MFDQKEKGGIKKQSEELRAFRLKKRKHRESSKFVNCFRGVFNFAWKATAAR